RGDIQEFSGDQYLWQLPIGNAKSYYEYQCFIPSISALDINTNDYFFDIDGVLDEENPAPTIYPFEAFYAPDTNQRHVFLEYDPVNPTDPKESNIAWLIDELENTRGISNGILSGTYNYG